VVVKNFTFAACRAPVNNHRETTQESANTAELPRLCGPPSGFAAGLALWIVFLLDTACPARHRQGRSALQAGKNGIREDGFWSLQVRASVGWVERSETHRFLPADRMVGFAALYPPCGKKVQTMMEARDAHQ
jgi:hypothetical protein